MSLIGNKDATYEIRHSSERGLIPPLFLIPPFRYPPLKKFPHPPLFNKNFPCRPSSFIHSRGHSKSMSPAYHRFLTPVPPCHTLSPFALTPSPLVTTQIVTNFMLILSRPLMQILDLIFNKMCLFSNQTLLFTWKATLKSRWGGVITTFKVILMQLLKRYFFEVVTSLFDPPPPLSHFD